MLKYSNMVASDERGSPHKPEVKYNCVVTWLATGNLRIAASTVNVPYNTARYWYTQPWWKEFEFEIANSKRTKTNNKLSKIVDKSLDLLEDRLENGEMVLNNKTGELIRKPVQVRDLNQVLNNVLMRQESLEKQKKEQSVLQQQESIADTFKMLAAEFAKFNGTKKPEIIDVEDAQIKEPDDALYEERETGLQEREREVQLEAGTSEESGGPKPSAFGIVEGGLSPQAGW
jgi:hypothetical protein